MSIAVRAKIIGMDPLVRKIRVLPDEARATIRAAMAREADGIVALMKRLAPVDSGDLRDSIGWTWGDKAPKGRMAIATKGKGDLSITIFAGNEKAFYAHMVEFGTQAHIAGGLFAGAEIPAIPAKPFFFPSFRALRKQVKKSLRKAARDAARKVAAS